MMLKILVIIIGIVFLYFGFKQQKDRKNKLNSGDFKEITGVVVDFDSKFKQTTDDNGRREGQRVYYPIYEYEVDGTKYSYTSHVGNTVKKGLGKTMTLLYNIKNPSECFSLKDKSNLGIMILGIALLGIGFYSLFI